MKNIYIDIFYFQVHFFTKKISKCIKNTKYLAKRKMKNRSKLFQHFFNVFVYSISCIRYFQDKGLIRPNTDVSHVCSNTIGYWQTTSQYRVVYFTISALCEHIFFAIRQAAIHVINILGKKKTLSVQCSKTGREIVTKGRIFFFIFKLSSFELLLYCHAAHIYSCQ